MRDLVTGTIADVVAAGRDHATRWEQYRIRLTDGRETFRHDRELELVTRVVVAAILLLLGAAGASAARQVAFPVNIVAAWDPLPASEGVTNYTVTFNGVAHVVAASSCSATECVQPLIVPSQGSYTISVAASNFWGLGDPATLTFTAAAPGRSPNVRIRVQ